MRIESISTSYEMGCGHFTGQLLQNPRVLRNKTAGFSGHGSISLPVLAVWALAVTSAFWTQQSASAQTQSCAIVQITKTTGENVPGYSVPPAISADGTHIAFLSSANIVNNENPD